MNTQGMIPLKENDSKKISDRYQKKTYAKGATCIYGDTLYRAKADITTAEEWTAAHWEETNMETIRAEMAAEVSSLNANVLKMVKKEYITENKNHPINLPLNTVCLVVMANTYNAGSCWIVQTGGSVQQALINTIFETSYFSAKSSGQSQITITSTSAVGWCYVWLLGKT